MPADRSKRRAQKSRGGAPCPMWECRPSLHRTLPDATTPPSRRGSPVYEHVDPAPWRERHPGLHSVRKRPPTGAKDGNDALRAMPARGGAWPRPGADQGMSGETPGFQGVPTGASTRPVSRDGPARLRDSGTSGDALVPLAPLHVTFSGRWNPTILTVIRSSYMMKVSPVERAGPGNHTDRDLCKKGVTQPCLTATPHATIRAASRP